MLETDRDSLLLDNQLCFALYAASRKVIHQYAPMLTEMDITYTQYLALLVLWEKQHIPIKKLCQALFLDTGTLTPMLKKMEQKGLLTRKRSLQDERVVMIELTETGSALREIALRHFDTLVCTPQVDPTALEDLRNRLQHLSRLLDGCTPTQY